MDYFRLKKKMLTSITHKIKGFVRRASGEDTVKLDDCVGGDWLDLDISGNSLQDGTPTPDAPVDVVSVGDLSVNLVKDVRESFKTFAEYTELEEDGRQCIRIKSHGSTRAIFDFTFKENTQYTISFDFKCKYDRDGVSLSYDTPIFIFYTDGNIDYLNLMPIDNTWRKKVYTTKANKTISHIQQRSFDYRVYDYIDINTFQIQEGATATPYEPFGKYKIPVVSRGINLFDISKTDAKEQTINGITFTPLDDERVHIKGKATDESSNIAFYYRTTQKGNMPIKRGIYRAKPTRWVWNGLAVMFGCNNGSKGQNINSQSSSTSLDMDNGYIGSVYIGLSGNALTREWDDIIELQLMEGTENLPYEPYIEPVTTNIFLDEPLRKIGDYADYIDFKNNKVVRNIRELDSAQILKYNLMKYSSTSYSVVNAYRFVPGILSVGNNARNLNIVCSNMLEDGSYIANKALTSVGYSEGGFMYLRFDGENNYGITDVTTLREWLSQNNLLAYCVRNTPAEEQIDLPQITTNKGTTVIDIDTTIQPNNVEIEYYKIGW